MIELKVGNSIANLQLELAHDILDIDKRLKQTVIDVSKALIADIKANIKKQNFFPPLSDEYLSWKKKNGYPADFWVETGTFRDSLTFWWNKENKKFEGNSTTVGIKPGTMKTDKDGRKVDVLRYYEVNENERPLVWRTYDEFIRDNKHAKILEDNFKDFGIN